MSEREVAVTVPREPDRCSGCGECQRICAFGAILALPSSAMVLPQLCHSCGACVLACRERALREAPRRIGVIRSGRSTGFEVRWGALDVGEPRAEPVVEHLLRDVDRGSERITVVDAAPGTSCLPMVAVRGSDLAVLVPEPTPMGLHDLRGALRMTAALGVPSIAVINRSDLGDDMVAAYLRRKGVPVVASIPFDERIARASAVGDPPELDSPALAAAIARLTRTVAEWGGAAAEGTAR